MPKGTSGVTKMFLGISKGISGLSGGSEDVFGGIGNGEDPGTVGSVCRSTKTPKIMTAITAGRATRRIFLLFLKLAFPKEHFLRLLDKWLRRIPLEK